MRIRTFSLFVFFTKKLMVEYKSIADELIDYVALSQVSLTPALISKIQPIFTRYFDQMVLASNTLVEAQISTLSRVLSVPFKYDRSVIDRVNGVSVFKGYYSDTYRQAYTLREIDRMKRVILKGAYEMQDERLLASNIQSVIDVSDRRARLLARNETSRLREATKSIFAHEPEVIEKYDRVWNTQGDGIVRPSHQEMEGAVSIDGTYFNSPTYGFIAGPGTGPAEFSVGCRCFTSFEPKVK